MKKGLWKYQELVFFSGCPAWNFQPGMFYWHKKFPL